MAECTVAQAAGLACDDDIVVDDCGRTSCDLHITAAALCGGADQPYRQAPWVWSDQYDLRLQSVGVFEAIDHTVQRGRPESGAFSLLHFRAGRFVALEGVNRPGDFGVARRLLNLGLGPTPAQAGDDAFDLLDLLPPKQPLVFETPWPHRHLGSHPANA